MNSVANSLVGIGNYLSIVIPKKTCRKSLYVFFLAFSALFQPLVVKATPVTIGTGYQLEGLGYFSGTLDYVWTSATRSSLTLVINNLPTTAAGGRITGVAFNVPTGASFSSMTATAPNLSFEKLDPSSNDIETSGLGDFDFGSSVGGSWLEDSAGSAGIAAGSSGTFVFNFRGTNLNTLSTLSFINAVAPNGSGSVPPQFMAVRFRGFTPTTVSSHSIGSSEDDEDEDEDEDDDAYYISFDEVGGSLGGNNPPTVPVPASVWLMLSGLGGLGLLSRKSKN